MPAILTVDDSRAVRTIVGKQVKELGFDVLEAEDGVQGLQQLAEAQVDLVLLDVTMPNLDGPGMLQQMRDAGNQTPVIMLTSESKRSIVAGAMKLGISDYILKPFKPEELRQKVLAVLQGEPGGALDAVVQSDAPAAPRADPEPGGMPVPTGAGRFVDVLVVDDMENVAKKLRSLLPPHLSLNAYTSAQSALGACRDRVYRVILVDTEIPDVNSSVLAQQIRVLQPHAALVALALKTSNDVAKEAKDQGFDDALLKPFRPETVDDFLLQYFDNQDFLQVEGNVLKVAPYSGRADRVERFYTRLNTLYSAALEKVAAACYDEVLLDLGTPPIDSERLPKFVIAVYEKSKEFGMTLALVGAPDVKSLFAGFEETTDLKVYASLSEARAALAA
ncbi:MAG TPA: response regulator [Anaeromyxobacteraceae bacterium]|nr:response regulator [Anaeromyxobacteraceae bacterium]